jgi:hypothetical protein
LAALKHRVDRHERAAREQTPEDRDYDFTLFVKKNRYAVSSLCTRLQQTGSEALNEIDKFRVRYATAAVCNRFIRRRDIRVAAKKVTKVLDHALVSAPERILMQALSHAPPQRTRPTVVWLDPGFR